MPVQSVQSQRSFHLQGSGNINRGDRGPAVTQLQQRLNQLGFNCGSADGVFGPKTEAAVKAFQRAHHLEADGIVGPHTRAALERGQSAPAPAPTGGGTAHGSAPAQNLQRGSSGGAVRELQGDLNRLGYSAGSVDGQYGPKTEGAVKRFQAQWGLSVDGQYGPQTRGALNRALAGERPPHPNATPPSGGTGGTQGPGPVNQPGGSGAGRAALDSARSQLGVREATGNNDGVPAQRYAGGRREPWCADFVSWNFRQTGHPLPGNQRMLASVQYMEDTMKQNGKWFSKSHTPQPGDIIFFRWPDGGRHVGIVESVSGGRVNTVEGNTSNMVARRSYPLDSGSITGYARH
ncbi:MAG: peptidoglycan-binding protein [Deltaproteobacteria bacterium]|nr:peptidoglycan-binding protein [Deltaproteobacteria bacterium]